jgi:kynurenine formamidase
MVAGAPTKRIGDKGALALDVTSVPPVVAQGVLLDAARASGVARLEPGTPVGERGVYLLEWLRLEEPAAARAHEFPFIALPLKIKGTTGSWLRPVAMC